MGGLDAVAGWDVPAAAAAVFHRDGIHESSGDLDRPFPLASLSKPLAAVATLIAVEEGVVDLDDPVNGAPAGATLRHLLAHASGLSPDDPDRTVAEVGARRVYSNAGFELLADHVATAAAMSFADYAAAALVETLGLAATDVSGSPAHGYQASVRDLVHVARAVVGHQLLAPQTVEAMTAPAFPLLDGVLPGYGRQAPNPWGLGVELRGDKQPHWTSPANSPATWGHFGRAGTFLWWDPSVDVGLVVLTDREFGPWAVDAWPPLSTAVLDAYA